MVDLYMIHIQKEVSKRPVTGEATQKFKWPEVRFFVRKNKNFRPI